MSPIFLGSLVAIGSKLFENPQLLRLSNHSTLRDKSLHSELFPEWKWETGTQRQREIADSPNLQNLFFLLSVRIFQVNHNKWVGKEKKMGWSGQSFFILSVLYWRRNDCSYFRPRNHFLSFLLRPCSARGLYLRKMSSCSLFFFFSFFIPVRLL